MRLPRLLPLVLLIVATAAFAQSARRSSPINDPAANDNQDSPATRGWVRSVAAPRANPVFTGTATIDGQLVLVSSATGIVTTATDPLDAAGVAGTTYNANTIRVTEDVSTGGAPSGGLSQALLIDHRYGGRTSQANHQSLAVKSFFTATDSPDPNWTNRNHVAGAFVAKAYAPSGAPSPGGRGAMFGLNPVAELSRGATGFLNVSGIEANVAAFSPVENPKILTGVQAVKYGGGSGTTYDAAYGVGSLGTGGWKTALYVSADHGAAGLAHDGSVIASSPGMTVANGIDLTRLTISRAAFASPGFGVNGDGMLTSTNAKTVTGIDAALYTLPGAAPTTVTITAANARNNELRDLEIGGASIKLAGGPVGLPPFTVGALPACTSGRTRFAMAVVTDFNGTPAYRGPVAGGGSTVVPVFCNGQAWEAH